MSVPVSPAIQNDLKLLEKHINEFLKVDLEYVLQPAYIPKARQSVDAILTLVSAINEVQEDDQNIHHTTIDTGLKNLQAVHKALVGHYTEPTDQAALAQSLEALKKIVSDIKKLRGEVARVEPASSDQKVAAAIK